MSPHSGARDRSRLRWGARGDHFPQSIKYVMVINSFFLFQYLLFLFYSLWIYSSRLNFKKYLEQTKNSDLLLFQFEIDSHICQNDTYYIVLLYQRVAGKLRVTLSPPGVKNPVVDNAFFQAWFNNWMLHNYTINFFSRVCSIGFPRC